MADKGEFAKDLRKLSVQQARGYLQQLGLAEADLAGILASAACLATPACPLVNLMQA